MKELIHFNSGCKMTANLSAPLLTSKAIFLANWGGYYPLKHSLSLLDKLLEDCNPSTQQYYLSMPYGYLEQMPEQYRQSGLIFGTDKIPSMDEGTFTESISVKFIKNTQAKFALINSNENKQVIPKKIKGIIQAGLTPFLCIRELTDLPEKLPIVLEDLSPHQLINLNIIYEAAWIHKLAYQPSLEQLIEDYRQFREHLQSQMGIQIANGLRLICAVPHDFEDLTSLIKESGANGLYLEKAIFHQNQLHRMFASDLHLHGEFEMPVIDENAPLLANSIIVPTEEAKDEIISEDSLEEKQEDDSEPAVEEVISETEEGESVSTDPVTEESIPVEATPEPEEEEQYSEESEDGEK